MKTAKEILTKYSDGDYTQYQGYENILLAMKEYAEQFKLKQPLVMPSLLAAGKLALIARLVTKSNAKNLSQRIEQMESALDAYDNEIMSISNEA